MNPQAKVYKTKDADIDMDKILNVKAFDLNAKVEINPGILNEEVPFEWAAIYELNEFEYSLALDEGPDPTMDIAIVKVDSAEENEIENGKKLAIKLFSEASFLIRPQKFLKTNNALNQLVVDDKVNEYKFKMKKNGYYILYTQHHPNEFGMKIFQNENLVWPLSFREFEHTHEHDNAVSSVGIDTEGELDLQKMDEWINWLLQNKGTDIFRMKGILNIKGNDERFVFQGVHMLFDAQSDRKWRPGEKRKNQVVFIGKNLNREEIMKGFQSCLIRSKEAVL